LLDRVQDRILQSVVVLEERSRDAGDCLVPAVLAGSGSQSICLLLISNREKGLARRGPPESQLLGEGLKVALGRVTNMRDISTSDEVSARDRRHRLAKFLASPWGIGTISGTLLVGIVLAGVFSNFFSSGTVPALSSAPAGAGSQAAFGYLARQHTNFCSLQQDMVMRYPIDKRLQGACCNPLDKTKYQYQVSGLRAFAGNRDMPSDPYDIPVVLAKRLLTYDNITLLPLQQAVYDRAISMTRDKGPCCCQCWRWYMTRGLAKSLIAQHHLDSATVAKIIDLTNGCGGRLDAT
jgi:hypothetical protein